MQLHWPVEHWQLQPCSQSSYWQASPIVHVASGDAKSDGQSLHRQPEDVQLHVSVRPLASGYEHAPASMSHAPPCAGCAGHALVQVQ